MKNKRGFTLIELLAVIIILGILLLIAIPGVTSYINNSRKNVYVDTAKELIKGTSNLLNSGDFDTLDGDVTYYMDSRCIANESGKESQSPFGKFNPAYVLVVSENDEYNYYFQSRDETEVGVKDITGMDSLEISKIVSGVKEEDIDTSVGIGNTTKTAVIDQNCHIGEAQPASRRVSKDGESMITLTFDNQGGTGCDMQSQYYGEEWGKLCKPKKEGWKFIGWYTKPNKQGDKITKTTKAEKSMTVYAAWTDQYAIFDTGKKVNAKMKSLGYGNNVSYGRYDENIIYIKKSEEEPNITNQQDNNVVSAPNSIIPIYAWFDSSDGTIYWWSEDENPILNSDSSYMFALYNQLLSIDGLTTLDTSNVTDMSYMFYRIKLIQSIDVSNFDTSSVTSMKEMFRWCEKLLSMDLSNFDTSQVTDMSGLFCNNYKNINIDVSSLDTSNVTDMHWMFASCNDLFELNISNFDTSNVTNMYGMFSNCYKLLSLDVSSFDTSNVTDMNWMYRSCYKIEILDLSHFDTSKVTDMGSIFAYCYKLTSLNINNFDTSNVTNMSQMFCECSSIESLDLSNFITSNVTSMYEMFQSCDNLSYINLTSFNTSKVTNMNRTFSGCKKITSLDLSNFDTSNVNDMSYMFYFSIKIKSINLISFNTSKVTTFNSMFEECSSLESLDLSSFNTSNVTDMTNLFCWCTSLTSVDVSSFNTSNVTSMNCMFGVCQKLKIIDLSNFDTSKVQDFTGMFGKCYILETIYASENFITTSVRSSTDIFWRCYVLKGGSGTEWDASMENDITKAHIDGGISNPGLFTLKT